MLTFSVAGSRSCRFRLDWILSIWFSDGLFFDCFMAGASQMLSVDSLVDVVAVRCFVEDDGIRESLVAEGS